MFRLSEVDARFSIGLLVFTPKTIIGFGIRGWYKILLRAIGFHPEETLYGVSVIRILWQILLQPNSFHPENNYIWGIGYLSLMQDPPFGLLDLTPKRHSIWASAIYVLCRILLRVIGLHPEAKHGYIWKWSNFGLMEFYLAFGIDWPSVIGILDKGAPKRLSLFVKRRGESSAHCKWMPLGEMSPGLAKLSGPQHPLVSILTFS